MPLYESSSINSHLHPSFFFWFVCLLLLLFRVTNLYNMLPIRTAGQLEVLLLVIRYAKEAKLVAMLASFFAGVDAWIKVLYIVGMGFACLVWRCSPDGTTAQSQFQWQGSGAVLALSTVSGRRGG